MPRATDSGSFISASAAPGMSSAPRFAPSGDAPPLPRAPRLEPGPRRKEDCRLLIARSEVDGLGRDHGRVEGGADAQLLLDLLLELVGQVRVVLEEVARVLFALAELVTVVGVPS